MLRPCPCCSLEKGVKALAIVETVFYFLVMISSGVECLKNLRAHHQLAVIFHDTPPGDVAIHYLIMVNIAVFLVFFLILLLNIGLYYWGAEKKKEGICWVWLGWSITNLIMFVISDIQNAAGVKIGTVGGKKDDANATSLGLGASLIFDVGQCLGIWVVLSFVLQLRDRRKARQLGLSVGDANARGVGGKHQEALFKVANSGHSYSVEQSQSSPVYQPTSTISTV